MIERFSKSNNISDKGITVSRKILYGDFETHWHDFFEIEFIVSGDGKYIIDDREYIIKKNMLFFMTPINFHSVKFVGNAEIINVMFLEELCNRDVLSRIVNMNKDNAVLFSTDTSNFIYGILTELIFATECGDKMYYKSLLNTLLIKISNNMASKDASKLPYVQSTMLFVLNNFRKKISLIDAARYVGLSPAYLSTIFPKHANITFKEFLDNIRLDYSKNMIINSDMSVSDVCFESGFCDYSNFIRKFKGKFGISPGQYRKKHQNY